ncbi:MAG: OmcA/MtrC family decaheme c-type cytochrome [Steroidobacteraceae bacterium]|nr:OmcA/MtrC family decaheme c-type cytochrome [Steroidobacteraceae bacterium]
MSEADAVIATVTSVTAQSPVVVNFRLTDRDGNPLKGQAASGVRFALAKLVPEDLANGRPSEWVSYINVSRAPNAAYPDGSTQIQATTETGNATRFVDNGDGTYRYTFSFDIQNVTTPVAVPFEPNLTHRVALQLGSNSINNAAYDFVPAGGAVTAQREIVNNAACNACHDVLFFHGGSADGGGRRDLQYCVTCHNPGSADPETNNSVDMMIMTHKIHAGAELANGYSIVGYGNTFYDYSNIEWTQDIRNCGTCHQEDDATVPQASNWRKTVTAEACGSCHDAIDFATGVGHGGITVTDNRDCQVCHGPNSTFVGGSLRAEVAHLVPAQEAAKDFEYQVVSVAGVQADGSPGAVAGKVSPGEYPLVTIKVINPNTGVAYDINDQSLANPFFAKPGASTSLSVDVAWSTKEFINVGSGSATATTGTPGQPVQIGFLANTAACLTGVPCPPQALGRPVANADGSFTKAALRPVPATGVTGSGAAIIEGRPAIDTNPDPAVTTYERIRVVSVGKPFAITDNVAVARRSVVETAKCNDCHFDLSIHGGGRTANTELCSTCHNPNITCRSTTQNGTTDLKVMTHGLHAGTFNSCGHDFTDVVYPGRINNCEGCHKSNTFYPVDGTKVFATSIVANDRSNPDDDIRVTPNLAVCSTCHTTDLAVAHMTQNGGSSAATQLSDGTPSTIETCALCHGPGKASDLREAHKIDQFVDN